MCSMTYSRMLHSELAKQFTQQQFRFLSTNALGFSMSTNNWAEIHSAFFLKHTWNTFCAQISKYNIMTNLPEPVKARAKVRIISSLFRCNIGRIHGKFHIFVFQRKVYILSTISCWTVFWQPICFIDVSSADQLQIHFLCFPMRPHILQF